MVITGEKGLHDFEDYEDECVEQITVLDNGRNLLSKDQVGNKYAAVAKIFSDQTKSDVSKSKTLQEMMDIAAKAAPDLCESTDEDEDGSDSGGASSGMDSDDARDDLFGARKKKGKGSAQATKASTKSPKGSSSSKAAPSPSSTRASTTLSAKSASAKGTSSQGEEASSKPAGNRLGGGKANEDVHIADGRVARLKRALAIDTANMEACLAEAKDLGIEDDVICLGDTKAFTDGIKKQIKVCAAAKAKLKISQYKIERSSNRAAFKEEDDALTEHVDDLGAAMKLLQLVQGGKSSLA